MPDNVIKLDLGRPVRPWGFYPANILERPPPPQWLIDGLVLRGTVTILAGDGKIGKSLLLQQLLSAAALGKPCLGRHVERAKSFGYFCEDTQDWLVRRQFDICAALDADMMDFEDNYSWESRADTDSILADFEFGKMALTDEWRKLWAHVDENGCELIGIDTARAVFAGNETRANQVTPFVRALQAEAIKRSAAILLLAHPAKGDRNGIAGNAAWLNSARHGISMQRPPDYNEENNEPRDVRILRGLGANYSAGRSVDRLVWRDGVFEAEDTPLPRMPVTSIDKMDLDYRVLAGVRRVLLNGGRVPADELAVGSMPRRARASGGDLSRMPFNALYESQDRLLARSQLVRVRVDGVCLIRPHDMKYDTEELWEK